MKHPKKLKILFVAMSDSIHTARWLNQIADQGWELHLFPCFDKGLSHPDLANITVHHSVYSRRDNPNSKVTYRGLKVPKPIFARGGRWILDQFVEDYRAKQLIRLIKKLQPDIIHSMEFSLAGYLTMRVKKILHDKKFPQWIATNWGSDIYLFGRLKSHQQKIREILANCDYYSCECQRDVCLAQNLGLKGKVLPVFPNAGGFDLKQIKKYRARGKTSSRKIITLKGYQNWAGRALVGLRALERCADLIREKGYELKIFGADYSPDVVLSAELFAQKTGIKTTVIANTTHQNILKLHGSSRISISSSISDAISTSLLEAMVTGSFPIQSSTACAGEWIKDGQTGILVPPDDPDIIEKAIRRGLTDDNLVDEAAKINWRTIQERLDKKIIKQKIIDFYREVEGRTR